MVNSSTAVHFNVLPGIATEAMCVFDLQAPRLQLAQLGYLAQLDPGGRVSAGPARPLLAARPPRIRLLTVVISAAIALVGFVVALRFAGGGEKEQAQATATATVELDSQPPEATVEIDGVPMGSTPLVLTRLAPGATISAVFTRAGYRTATARLQVPAAGGVARHVQPLQLSGDFVRVRFVSNPPGAEVIKTGAVSTIDRTYTPAEVLVQADQLQRFTLIMPRHVPLVIEPFTPARGAAKLEKGGDLVEGATLRIEGPPGSKVTVSGAPHCRDIAPPFDCILAPGAYVIEYGPDGRRLTHKVTMGPADEIVKLPSPPPPRK
jgi:hypothetical protein